MSHNEEDRAALHSSESNQVQVCHIPVIFGTAAKFALMVNYV